VVVEVFFKMWLANWSSYVLGGPTHVTPRLAAIFLSLRADKKQENLVKATAFQGLNFSQVFFIFTRQPT